MIQTPTGPLLPGTRHALLSFDMPSRTRDVHGRAVATFSETPQLPFLPLGLILWGATDETLVHGVKVGNMTEVEVGGFSPIPGRYFEQGRSFEDLQRLADAGELESAIDLRQQLMMDEAQPGTMVSVSLSGPCDRFVVWGRTYEQGVRPYSRAAIERLESGAYSGRLDYVGLKGIRTVLDVSTPDAQSAATLLVGLASPYARS